MTHLSSNRARDPFIPSGLQATLGKGAGRALGLLLIVLALLISAMLWTWSPDDPSFFNAVERVPQNALGHVGASLAEVLMRAIGWAAWALPVSLGVWGYRLALRRGEGRFVPGIVLLLPMIALTSVFAAMHLPPVRWLPDYGLGGQFGDGVGGLVLGILPLATSLAVPVVALVLGLGLIVLGSIALGVTRAEWRVLMRFLRTGIVAMLGLMTVIAGLLWSQRGRFARAEAAPVATPTRVARAEPSFDDDEQDELPLADTASLMERLRASQDVVVDDDDEEDDDPLDAPIPVTAPVARRADPTFRPVVEHKTAPVKVESRAVEPEEKSNLAPVAGEEEVYDRPPLSLLESTTGMVRQQLSDDALEQNARLLESVLDDYGIRGEIVSVKPGPVVTMYELEPAPGLKASRVIGLADDIARSMSALAARVSTVPGRSIIGIELPNENREKVLLREILSSGPYGDSKHKLPLALGKDIGGEPIVTNLARMPHLLIAGTTGSGKSVAINTMILSLLYRLGPDDCRMIMIDPKMLELSVYDGIPHLLSPVVTDPKKAVVALKWTVAEMEERYRKMSKMGVRNIDGYNSRVADALTQGENFSRTVQTGFDEDTGEPIFETEEFAPEKMPYIVVIVDEMADLMMVAGKEIEACIQRLAQMARASGIHLIMATQRPSVDVITGTIKANFPTRISFQVTSKIDSRTILGEMGAEQLLGMGDMLYMAGGGRVTRVHGPFVSDEEVEDVVNHLKALGAPEYISGVVEGPDDGTESDIDLVLGLGGNTGSEDALYDQAVAIVARDRKCSTSYIQRKLAIGYNKAARLVEQMEDNGVVSAANKVGKRDILVPEMGDGRG
ncbi:DNA segregation ATPase FtsK/SpoIIIE [Monaibacterium marinum]|uniref:DNA translocase FtsK n=1 Tax=Pontivivens marinum TaxID=1690039 RepID=A0A2C9CMQ5_9RHOB|nr:DNA translocase FtsK 4TM domain-containing protein [Monaibacterium marinum]SOH92584.1 DNA segregation ATPase FtsK/SpoIIIE [Monaibacterium marinum]